jgi:hypothetical protein
MAHHGQVWNPKRQAARRQLSAAGGKAEGSV